MSLLTCLKVKDFPKFSCKTSLKLKEITVYKFLAFISSQIRLISKQFKKVVQRWQLLEGRKGQRSGEEFQPNEL
jgi:hypothetical protein